MPPWVRFAVAGVVAACFGYAMMLFSAVERTEASTDEIVEKLVVVPQLDDRLLDEARDDTRAERLILETEPLRHLLAKAIDVGPTVAAALQIPEDPVPLAELRADRQKWRRRWLWYEGRLTQLSGPRPGHPIEGYSIYEATIELADGQAVIAAFSVEPRDKLAVGDWVRVEGYLLKLRDTTYPEKIESAPMLVGRTLQRDYQDWPEVTELDQRLLATIDDTSYLPGDTAFHTIEEDQTEVLWHLGAFVRDTADQRSLAAWRKVPTLTSAEPYEQLRNNELARGTPMRVFGTLIRRQTIAAPANPANIKFWTTAFIQVREFGGHLVPIWVPGRVDELPARAQLEVRGFYYRWFAYDAKSGNRFRVPLFVAADLDRFELETDETMREIGIWIGGFAFLMLGLIIYGQRRMARTALQHSKHMDERRRRRREQARARATSS